MHGAFPGHGQEINSVLHPHLQLERTMIHMPTAEPGDYVAWHCDSKDTTQTDSTCSLHADFSPAIHAVDAQHSGDEDSSVLYIPVCPLTEDNVRYLHRQRATFLEGLPSCDFGGGIGESQHQGRVSKLNAAKFSDIDGRRSMGIEEWDEQESRLWTGERQILRIANQILGFV
jgi:hypothetical protein